jgi:hypothetical protein
VTCVSLALALDAATANSPLAAEHLLVENLVAPLVPHLVAGLGLVGDPAAAAEATPGAGGGVPPPTAALEPLIHIVTRVVNGPNAFLKGSNGEGAEEGAEGTAAQRREVCARSAAMRADFVELLVASGAVDALASLFALHDRPKQDVEPVPPAILAGLRMLEALLDARVPAPGVELGEDHAVGIGSSGVAQSKTTFVSDCESPAGSLIAALRETALAGLPSLLTSVLLQTEATLRTPVLADPAAAARALPPNFRRRRQLGASAAQRHREVRADGGAGRAVLSGPARGDAPLALLHLGVVHKRMGQRRGQRSRGGEEGQGWQGTHGRAGRGTQR